MTFKTYPKPLSFELSHGSRLLLAADLNLPGKALAIANLLPLGGLPGRLSLIWGLGAIVGAVHSVILPPPISHTHQKKKKHNVIHACNFN